MSRPAWEASLRFRANSHYRWYCLGKSFADPAYSHLAKNLAGSDLPLLDVGCGAGTLAAFLRASGFGAPVVGIDPDAEKIRIARAALPDCTFAVGDAQNLPAHAGHIAVLDVLHYLGHGDRASFFREIAARLPSRGRAYLRTALRDRSWRFAATRLEEAWVNLSGWIPFRSNPFPSREELETHARDAGLLCRILPMFGKTPFNSHLAELSPR